MKAVLLPWLAGALLKLAAYPAYHSTDFDVHANWLRITSTQPRSQWYWDAQSPWTLDYPPLFAWFERALALCWPPAELMADPSGFTLDGVLWQRTTVVASEFVFLGGAVALFASSWPEKTSYEVEQSQSKVALATALVALDPNLFVVDHVHFQYNGFLLGVLVLGMWLLRIDRPFTAAAVFAILFCLKHIFLYMAPLLGVYYLRRYCVRSPVNVVWFGCVVGSVVAASLASVCNSAECVVQVGKRLFPVGERGLLHAYWAPNFWALYAGADVVLKQALHASAPVVAVSPASGLVAGAVGFSVLPTVAPWVTLVVTLGAMTPLLVEVWRTPRPPVVVHAVASAVLCSFLFGYHVHEKALVMASVPLALVAVDSAADAKAYLMLCWITNVALAPLLFPASLSPLKAVLLLLHASWATAQLDEFHRSQRSQARVRFTGLSFGLVDRAYLTGLALVFAAYHVGPGVLDAVGRGALLRRYPFVPLLVVSVYCALGVALCFADAHALLRLKCRKIEVGSFAVKIASCAREN